jgi:hypothetical protein
MNNTKALGAMGMGMRSESHDFGQSVSLSSSLDFSQPHRPTLGGYARSGQIGSLKPDALMINMRSASVESLESNPANPSSSTIDAVSKSSSAAVTKSSTDTKEEASNQAQSPTGTNVPPSASYDMLEMLATVADRNGKEILNGKAPYYHGAVPSMIFTFHIVKSSESTASTSSANNNPNSTVSSSNGTTLRGTGAPRASHVHFENPIPEQVM